MKKENKKPLILWALVALVLGVILGLVITNITTTGKAKSALGLNSVTEEANLQEARRDLVLRNLQVSNILANTAYDQQINVSSYLKANSGVYANELLVGTDGLKVKNIYSSDNDNPSINFLSEVKSQKGFYLGMYGTSNAFMVSPNTGSAGNGNSEITIKAPITIGASTKFNQLINDVEVAWGLFNVGDTITANTYLITVLDILDANNTAVLNFTKDDISTDYYATEGDIILGLIEVGPIDSSFVQLRQILSGNAYACLTADGTLYRSYNPCN